MCCISKTKVKFGESKIDATIRIGYFNHIIVDGVRYNGKYHEGRPCKTASSDEEREEMVDRLSSIGAADLARMIVAFVDNGVED